MTPTRIASLLLIALAAASASQPLVIRMNCGSPVPYVPPGGGPVWAPERPYNPLDPFPAGYVGGVAQPGFGVQLVGGTRDEALFRDARRGMAAWRFNVPPGTYAIGLGLAETEHHGPGFRVFSCTLEGAPAFTDLDLLLEHTRDYATTLRHLVTVTDGVLDVEFSATLGEAILNCIEITAISPDLVAPPPPPALWAYGGYAGTNVLDWRGVMAPDAAGYRVERANAPGGPWVQITGALQFDTRLVDTSPPVGPAYYRVVAEDLWGNRSSPSMVVTATTRSDPSTPLPILELLLDPLDQHLLDQDPFADVYVPASATIMGHSPATSAEVRYRGNVSRKFPKKSWKVRLPTDELHAGRVKLNLKSEFIEFSMIRDELSYQIFRARGLPTPDTRQVQLRVNGVYRGVFLDLEQVDENFLERHRLDLASDVFKSENSTFETYPAPLDYELHWDAETGSSHDEIIELCETVELTPAGDFPREIAARLDLQEFLDYWAIQVLLANTDFTFHNYYMSYSPQAGHWIVVPWDMDHSFGNMGPFSTTIRVDTPIDAGSQASPLHPGGGFGPQYNLLYDRLMQVDLFRHMYCRKLEALMAGEFSQALLVPRITAAHARLIPEAEADVYKSGWEDPTRFHEGQQLCQDFIQPRCDYLASQLGGYAPAYTQRLFINEVLARNTASAVDGMGEHEDYVELYNGGGAVEDLSGMYLTDDALTPTVWALPAGTTLAPGERLLIWCDGEVAEGPLHAAFSLSGEGEHVALYHNDGQTLVDVVHWSRQLPDVALARQGDGNALFIRAQPTPGLANGTTPADLPPIVWGHRRDPVAPAVGESARVTVVVDDDHDAVTSVLLSYDAGTGVQTLTMRDDGTEGDGASGDGCYGATIPGVAAGTTVSYHTEAQDSGGLTGRDPEETEHTYAVGVATPTLLLNEFMAANTSIPDPLGEDDDWVELYNPTGTPVDLGGMFLTDDLGDLQQWQAPAGLVVPALGHLLLWADGQPQQGAEHTSFRLSAGGEDLALVAADGVTVVDSVVFGVQVQDISWGRDCDGGGTWVAQPVPSPGASNSCSAVVCVPGCGDCNDDGSVNIVDALYGAQHAVALITLTGLDLDRCDTDGSGVVDVLDALSIAMAAVGTAVISCCP